MEIIPVLLKQKAVGRSICSLTPTKSAASKADIDVYIHRNKCLQVGDKKVQSAKFIVRKARTMTVDITLEVSVDSKPLSLKLTECLDRRGSCGQTVADHIYSICSKKDAWFHARKRTVGEVLYIFLREEKALLAIQSLPLFLSFPMQYYPLPHSCGSAMNLHLSSSTSSPSMSGPLLCTYFQRVI